MAFVDELTRHGDKVLLRPQDEHGLLDLADYIGDPDARELVYCCGPALLLDAIGKHCVGRPEILNIERFAGRVDVSGEHGESFEVVFGRSGRTAVVPPGTSILTAAQEAGVAPPSSCTEGICGTCETEVISGRPEHRDSVLSDDDRDRDETMMICVSRSLDPRLVLDL
ncbi:flavin reductase family protein [Microbacterium sp. HSID17254]|uniref:flavin reductase family protein n=1 Tax=Microbacterium sp. HSID17254 TaxID=2419509 RepID=UPI001EE84207|nr:iron-sulfur cluster-binding domain-containing protein [Microbacterium sp. HSID17254]